MVDRLCSEVLNNLGLYIYWIKCPLQKSSTELNLGFLVGLGMEYGAL